MAMVPAGFVYRGQFYGRALSTTGWKSISMPAPDLLRLLRKPS